MSSDESSSLLKELKSSHSKEKKELQGYFFF